VPVPSVVLPSLKVTVPVAADGVTVAVNFTELPYVDGFNEDATLTDDDDFANANSNTDAKQIATHRRRDTVRTGTHSFVIALGSRESRRTLSDAAVPRYQGAGCC